MSPPPPASLLSFLAEVPDPRSAHGRRHSLTAMLAAVVCAILCGARGFKPIAQWVHDQDIALMHALGFTRTPPRWGAFRKLLLALAPEALERAVACWAEATAAGLRDLCDQVLQDGGHYFLVVKENQPELLRDIRETFTQAADVAFSPSPATANRAAVHRAPHRGQAWRPGRIAAAARHRPGE